MELFLKVSVPIKLFMPLLVSILSKQTHKQDYQKIRKFQPYFLCLLNNDLDETSNLILLNQQHFQ